MRESHTAYERGLNRLAFEQAARGTRPSFLRAPSQAVTPGASLTSTQIW